MKQIRMSRFSLLLIPIIVTVYTAISVSSDADTPFDWRSDWATERDFSISIDTEGYQFPISIAFVPNPGKDPKDPLYFVTELKGTVKVVTNDRTVFTFAEKFFRLITEGELPSFRGQTGLTGICLEPKYGYVFVTFTYHDDSYTLRNNVVRFQTKPETFSINPTSMTSFTEVFSSYRARSSHQIGHCQVKDDLLYVSIGDGLQTNQSQQLNSLLGKVVRMTLDGRPHPDNPFYRSDDLKEAANYVWAYGLRNPFGLKIVEDRVFVADNGLSFDRLLEVQKGENYLWDGSDASIGTSAAAFFTLPGGVAHLDFYPRGSSVFPKRFEQSFFWVVSGGAINTNDYNRENLRQSSAQVLYFNYDFNNKRLISVPKPLLKYRGSGLQSLAGAAFGPDSLYLAPIYPNKEGKSAILKITYNKNNEHPFLLANESDPIVLMRERGCLGCHTLNKSGGGTVGPSLNREDLLSRLEAKLNSDLYLQSVKKVDSLGVEPFASFKDARREVLEAKGNNRLEVWIKYRILEPRFDDPNAQMPNLEISEKEARIIANYLLGENKKVKTFSESIKRLLPRFAPLPKRELTFFSFIGGFFAGGFLFAFSSLLLRKMRIRGAGR